MGLLIINYTKNTFLLCESFYCSELFPSTNSIREISFWCLERTRSDLKVLRNKSSKYRIVEFINQYGLFRIYMHIWKTSNVNNFFTSIFIYKSIFFNHCLDNENPINVQLYYRYIRYNLIVITIVIFIFIIKKTSIFKVTDHRIIHIAITKWLQRSKKQQFRSHNDISNISRTELQIITVIFYN